MAGIRNIHEFCKLYKVSVPLPKEADYYLEILQRSREFRRLPEQIAAFAELERALQATGESLGTYRNRKFEQLKAFILATEAYQRFQQAELPQKLRSKRLQPVDEGSLLVSVDIVKANYSVLRVYDREEELASSWDDFCVDHEVALALARSKSFRQMLFGNLNPRRSQRLQHGFMHDLLVLLEQHDLDWDRDVAFASHDELFLVCGATDEQVGRGHRFLRLIEAEEFELPLRFSFFRLRQIEKGRFLKTNHRHDPASYELTESFRSLVGVPGNQFYMVFKEHVLNEPLDDRDLYFWNEHRLAKWVVT